MPDEKLNQILDNEREWRRHLLAEIKEIRKVTDDLKVKVATVASFVAFVSSAVTTVIIKKLGL